MQSLRPWLQLICACFVGTTPATTLADGPPVEPGPFLAPELVELSARDAGLRFDVRYATAHNFLGRPVYRKARVFLQKPAAAALVRAHSRLRAHGYGLLIFDGYRPWSVTKLFWESVSPDKRPFLADPKEGSRHNRGCAIDLSL
jgi:D-alanyl-D-alanine dipeptidase